MGVMNNINYIIYKYPLELIEEQTIIIPQEHKLLCVQMQYGQAKIWALVNNASSSTKLKVFHYGIGHNFYLGTKEYLGTYQKDTFVWHIFTFLIKYS